MARNRTAQRLKRRAVIALSVIGLGVVLLSPQLGRAHPQAGFRPPLPAAALTNGCYPLPSGLAFTFPYQVRTDGDTVDAQGRPNRTLVLQYDLIDADAATAALRTSFTRAGFRAVTPAAARIITVTRKDTGPIGASVVPSSVRNEDLIVRGTIVLTLPRISVQSDAPVCSDPNSTKRFPPGAPTLESLP